MWKKEVVFLYFLYTNVTTEKLKNTEVYKEENTDLRNDHY